MNRRALYSLLIAVLGLNLVFGERIYVYSAEASPKDDPYESYRELADVLEKIRQEYVDPNKVSYEDLIRGAMKGMVDTLDPHSEYMDPQQFDDLKKDTEGEFGGLGIIVQVSKDRILTVVSPMDDSPGLRAGLLPDDQIVKINGSYAAHMDVDDAVKLLRGQPGSSVTVTIHRPSAGWTKDFKLERAVIKVDTVKDINNQREFPISENGIGYVRIIQFGEKTSDELDAALKKLQDQGMKALVLDLRDNPGGLLEQAEKVCEKFLPRNELIVTTEGRGETPRTEYHAQGTGKRIDLPMVVLVNGNSASAAEIVSGCLQDLQPLTHAIVVGEQTFGKGSVQSILPLADGSALRLTTAKYYTPSHKVIHEHGITPDILVPMSPQDEADLHLKHLPGALEVLDPKDRERIEAVQDRQLNRAFDLLKGVLLYAQRAPAAAKVADAKADIPLDSARH